MRLTTLFACAAAAVCATSASAEVAKPAALTIDGVPAVPDALAEASRPYMELDLRRVEYGDERDPKQRAKLLEIAPLRRVSEIKVPLFVVQGANDPRVPKSEADQIVKAVRAGGTEAWYMVGENEDHGFAKKENQDYQFWATLAFWQKTLLGGAELAK